MSSSAALPNHVISSAGLTGRLRYGLTLLLAAALPFEIIQPMIELPWVHFTNLELLLAATAVTWGLHLLAGGRVERAAIFRPALVGPALAFLLLALLSALLAPAFRWEALKFTSRIAAGVYVLFLTRAVATSPARLAGLAGALVAGAGVSIMASFAEAIAPARAAALLALFRAAPTMVGGIIRPAGTFQYATIAAVFFEMVIPLTLVLFVTGRRPTRWLALLIALAGAGAIVLSLTRTGIVTLLATCTFLLLLAWRRPPLRRLAAPAGGTILCLALALALLAVTRPVLGARLVTENDLNWYRASYAGPASLNVTAGEMITVAVEAHNLGAVAWETAGPHPFALGYRWLSADGQGVLPLSHVEIALTQRVAPGQSVQVDLPVEVRLPAGSYRLTFGMLQHKILWFRHRGIPEFEIAVTVADGLSASSVPRDWSSSDLPPADDVPSRPPTVPRRQLWSAAAQMFAGRPLLGIGPDNFRHAYGTYLGMAEWDSELHANSLYLELLADVGLLGAGAFFVLMVVVGFMLLRFLWSASGDASLWAAGVSASLFAFFTHSILDYFLEFTATFVLFWMVLGMATALADRRRHPDVNGQYP